MRLSEEEIQLLIVPIFIIIVSIILIPIFYFYEPNLLYTAIGILMIGIIIFIFSGLTLFLTKKKI